MLGNSRSHEVLHLEKALEAGLNRVQLPVGRLFPGYTCSA
jgi:hypothetical protein